MLSQDSKCSNIELGPPMKIAHSDTSNTVIKLHCVDSKFRRRTKKLQHNFFLIFLHTFRDIHEKNMKKLLSMHPTLQAAVVALLF